ncbi:short-chain dehydrogenase [Shewanella sairae]|uniref:Short-chain dehydrogenase n=1 Tax=Shewanella sairae TaxID=190310 RepID=A0ABQ4PQV3_9GAMM|nr:SDR family oxidoreductase [Shewanella sairae]MCL1130610.1 SDR family oxidoreductase [Shewanella sairae]GIU51681.1 short-chain dehydrogenase [Shewanella sairae]
MHVFITGANRGIGLTFVKQYLNLGWRVTACCRDLETANELVALTARYESLTTVEIDLENLDELQVNDLALPTDLIDLVIHNAGYYGPKKVRFENIDLSEWRKVLEVNTLAPLLLSELLYPKLNITGNCALVFISSKVGSMADNTSGGGYYYRSSKAALNSVVKSLAIDLTSVGVKCVALHPGWVLTDMGGPHALISTDTSVAGMISVIGSLTQQQSGAFLDFQGKSIPW